MTTFIEELDEMLDKELLSYLQGLGLSSGQPLNPNDPVGKNVRDQRVISLRELILNLVSERIIDTDDYPAPGYRVLTLSKKHRNELRAEQRTTLYEGTKEGIEDGTNKSL